MSDRRVFKKWNKNNCKWNNIKFEDIKVDDVIHIVDLIDNKERPQSIVNKVTEIGLYVNGIEAFNADTIDLKKFNESK